MGKRGRKGKSKVSRAYFESRKIAGKLFHHVTSTGTKAKAKQAQKKLKNKGYGARIKVSREWGGRGYDVYGSGASKQKLKLAIKD